ncbi:DUF1311 domain-containing protein [Acinetobacter rudis]|uniref:lysozyme inhibitor LprI family protein n=1 Tax=Acinetobacter rudis TaxID=632955 RepID=UPI00280DF3DB|nr:lysozyme inhibitor LprI family protein [Acinetobacter rudis]MDQ8951358.1 DUF1311 domain-containing protein [Acinetobacter rudis]
MKNKAAAVLLISSGMLLSGCDYFKNKKDKTEEVATAWSCTSPENITSLQKQLNEQYVKQVDRDLRESHYYEADQQLLRTINQNLKFNVTEIRTVTTEAKDATKLSCEAQLVINLPKGLQQRATNAFAEHNKDCEECEENQTLQDYLEAGGASVHMSENKLSGPLKYELTKTDKDGYRLHMDSQNEVLNGLSFMVMKAVQFASYAKENKTIRDSEKENDAEHNKQQALAQAAMNIRQKELSVEKASQVEFLNETWESLSVDIRQALKQEQKEWFEKRDVECKVISQRDVYDLRDHEKETYQKQADYWTADMRKQNQAMQYDKCFIEKTIERREELLN